MMKKVMLAVLVVPFVQSPASEAAYASTISRQAGYTLEIVASAGVTTSVTFLSVVRGRLEVDNVVTRSGNLEPMLITISRSAERGILLVDTQGGSALIRINGDIHRNFPRIRRFESSSISQIEKANETPTDLRLRRQSVGDAASVTARDK
jgi:hypothetical protein